MTERIEAEQVFVDPKVVFCATRMVPATPNTMPLIREAAESALKRCTHDNREPVMVEVRIWVKP